MEVDWKVRSLRMAGRKQLLIIFPLNENLPGELVWIDGGTGGAIPKSKNCEQPHEIDKLLRIIIAYILKWRSTSKKLTPPAILKQSPI